MGPSKVVGCNAFLLCRCLQCFGNLMQLIVIAISSLNVYAVVLSYGSSVGRGGLNGLASFTAIVVFFAIVAMVLWSYWACVYTDPGRVPPNWHPFADDEEADRVLADINRISAAFHSADPRRPRYCRKCAAWKPERAHHCSMMGQCILRMDHYCIWVVNCVGLLNYKFFLLFVFYAFLGCLIGTMLLLWPCVATGPEAPVESTALLMAFVFDLVFTICLGAFLGMHGDMLRSNLTSIELFDYRSVKPWPYDLGSARANFEDVLGSMGWRWLLPMHGKERARMLVEAALQPRMAAFVDLEEGGVRGSTDGFASSQPVLRAGAGGVAYAALSDDLGQELAAVDT